MLLIYLIAASCIFSAGFVAGAAWYCVHERNKTASREAADLN